MSLSTADKKMAETAETVGVVVVAPTDLVGHADVPAALR
jgi:hypothetical protein